MTKRYEEIAADLRRRVRSGEFGVEGRLPSESMLVRTYKAGTPTVRHALGLLVGEGLIVKYHGRGTFVRTDVPLIEYANDRPSQPALRERARGRGHGRPGLDADLKVSVTSGEVTASPEIAHLMGVEAGTRLLEFVHLGQRPQDEYPCSVVRSYLRYDMVAGTPWVPALTLAGEAPWGDVCQHWLAAVSVELDHVEERLTARPPTADEAAELGVGPGTSVLEIQRVARDAEGRAVEVAHMLMRGDRIAAVYTTPMPEASARR
ncbi:GntR family transcriptional regulator [Streptomyces sp. NBC_01525]|uniref:GntR family transcriptional regulator n=1 Tax=Streptomyces sp. NBC_01525 TaxID=2903893 RepID=UPI003865FC60